MREETEAYESLNLQDKLLAMEEELEDKQNEIRALKTQVASSAHSDEEQNEIYELELEEKENIIAKLEAVIVKKDEQIEKLDRDNKFKESTLEFTHNVLVKNEKKKI